MRCSRLRGRGGRGGRGWGERGRGFGDIGMVWAMEGILSCIAWELRRGKTWLGC